ncbi:MAG: hypothetical protein HRT89_07510 [Lentisphaeria bacterium]|nr:hypothetical protein [Lentisphaeria bacterium]NQZ67901.1 hypothetical protein [Lentisphaeria bacterium]
MLTVVFLALLYSPIQAQDDAQKSTSPWISEFDRSEASSEADLLYEITFSETLDALERGIIYGYESHKRPIVIFLTSIYRGFEITTITIIDIGELILAAEVMSQLKSSSSGNEGGNNLIIDEAEVLEGQSLGNFKIKEDKKTNPLAANFGAFERGAKLSWEMAPSITIPFSGNTSFKIGRMTNFEFDEESYDLDLSFQGWNFGMTINF